MAHVRMEQHPAIPQMTREVAADALAGGPTLAQAITLTENTGEMLRQLTEALAVGEQVACRAGCDWCCSLTVIAASPPEVIRIAAYLQETFAPEELVGVKQRVAERVERLENLPPEKRRAARIPCPLLVAGCCSVYPVRPLACHGLVSSSATACEASYHSGWNRSIPNGPRHLGIAVGVREGVQQGLAGAGLAGRDLDLTRALRIALETPDAADRWLAGEPVFAAAEI